MLPLSRDCSLLSIESLYRAEELIVTPSQSHRSIDPAESQGYVPDPTSEESAENAYREMLEETRDAAKDDPEMKQFQKSLIADLLDC